jgi:S1-C subfamily serine protease
MIAGAVGIALAAGGVGAGIGLAMRAQPATEQSSSTSSGGSLPASGAVNAAAIAAALDPSIVDIDDVIGGSPAAGTGIVISSSGEVLTNNHVIDGATAITAQVAGSGPRYPVKVLGYDGADDVALLQIEGAPALHPAPLGSASALQVGDRVVALGNALGRGGAPAVATGTVTGLNQTVTASDGASSETLSGMIQVQVNIVPGDSGGPLVDAAGKVVGMDTAGSSSGRFITSGQIASSTTGFAIPIDTAMAVAHQIEDGAAGGGIVIGGSGPLIGVEVQAAVSPISPAGAGALIVLVVPGSPAAQAGLVAGDVIVSLDGHPVGSPGDLSSALEADHPGQTVKLGWVDASGAQHTSSITLAAGPPR